MKYSSGLLGFVCAFFILSSTAFAAEKIFYYHTDQAGTPLAMTDESGTVVWTADYKPFGEEQSINPATIENNEKFVGKEKDKETGLYYFGARYMKDSMGRFMAPDPVGSVDPMTGKINQKMLMNPQMLNPYSYGLNNPYKYIDPDGRWPEEVHNTIIKRAFLGGSYNLSHAAISAMQRGSIEADTMKYQDASHNYVHAMRSPDQSAEAAAGLTVTFIAQKMAEYKRLMAVGQLSAAYEALGMAMHPLMDATSPSHAGYQTWDSPYLHPIGAYNHGNRENKDVFNANPDYSKRAVDSVRGLYNEVSK